jgi:putative PIN family toxin of toxin-antitoxin system
LVEGALEKRFRLIVCPALVSELEDVLIRPKFRRYLTTDEALDFVALIRRIAENQPDPIDPSQATPDPDDDYLLALAQACATDCLVSGDPHLTELINTKPPILKPRAFLELFPA